MTGITGREGQKDAYVCSFDEESTGRYLREAMETISLTSAPEMSVKGGV
jgi:hypothetical protein